MDEMHLSSPDNRRSEPAGSHSDPDGAAQGGWVGFLLRAFLWSFMGWCVVNGLNCVCAPSQNSAPARPANGNP